MMLRKLAGAVTAAALGAVMLAVPATASTGGSGGSSSDLKRQSFTASNGLTSQYHIFGAGVPASRPVGLLVQFHGDGAYEFDNPDSSYALGGSSGIVAKAKAHGLLAIAALSPDKKGSVTWWESGAANADYARDLIQRVAFDRYNIDTDNIWLVGYSGGSQFVTQFFLPKHSSMVKGGGSVVFGGGGVPRVTAQPFSSPLVSNFDMHWYTGLSDDGGGGSYNALRDARAGSAYYAGRGFTTSIETPEGVGHGGLPFGQVVGQELDRHQAPAPGPTAGAKHSVVATRTGAKLTIDVPTNVTRTRFRVSKSRLGDQTGWYASTTRTGEGVTMSIWHSLAPGTKYYYQVERGPDRSVVVTSGTFTTLQ